MTHHDPHTTGEPAREPGSSWTGYAAVKYGAILIIVIVILYFLARYILPRF